MSAQLHHQTSDFAFASVETEAALIDALLFDNRMIDRVADIVNVDDFYDEFLGQVFEIALRERGLGNAVHVLSLRRFIGEEKAKLLIGMSAGSSGVGMIGAIDFAKEIHALARKRRLVTGLEALLKDARSVGSGFDKSADELISDAENVLEENLDEHDGSRSLTAAQCVERVVESMENQERGIRSGILSLDSAIGSLHKRNLVIVGGRPGMGKSALASSYALGAAKLGHGVLLFSLEMSAEEIGERMAADLCFDNEEQVPYRNITNGTVTNSQAREIVRAAERIKDLPLSVVDIGGASLAKLGALVRRHKRRFKARGHDLQLVIVDYLQLVKAQRRDNRTAEVGDISMGLKALAKSEDVAVMALCQLSRKVEERSDKRPRVADLRESGQIEQDADVIVFLYSAEYYLLQDEETEQREIELEQCAGKIEFLVPKRRRGPATVGHGRYFRAYQAVRS